MAKKILAVVLAVMMAVSAMAVTAFADQRIDLYPYEETGNYANDSHNFVTETVTFDIPVYGLYGYLTAGDYMELTLPANWGWNIPAGVEVNWSIVVNGASYALPTHATTKSGYDDVFKTNVVLGFLAHHYDGGKDVADDDYTDNGDTAIPQSIGYNTINSVRLVAQMTYDSGWNPGWNKRADVNAFNAKDGAYRNLVKAVWHYDDGTEVPGSISYASTWNAQAADSTDKNSVGLYDFVTNEWTASAYNDSKVPLTWDHNLGNRAIIYGADSAELVVELNKKIAGQAVYTLYANKGDALYPVDYNGLWWNYSDARQYVSQVYVDGAVSELRFPVDLKFLYETNYGTYNRQFVIFENITLLQPTIMSNYLEVDRAKVEANGFSYGSSNNTFGRLSWGPSFAGNRLSYDGVEVNYARTGMAGQGAVSGYYKYVKPADPTKVVTKTQTNEAEGTWAGTAISFKDELNALVDDGTIKEDSVVTFTAVDANGKASNDIMMQDETHGWDLSAEGKQYQPKFPAVDGVITISGKTVIEARNDSYGPQLLFGSDKAKGTWTATCTIRDASQFNADGTIKGVTTTADDPAATKVPCDADDPDAITDYTASGNAFSNNKADVMATAIYLNFPEPEAEPAPDETVTTPTEETDQAADDEQVDVGDTDEPAETTPAPAEQNPPTGLVLAVVPMLVAAAAAVVAKKH